MSSEPFRRVLVVAYFFPPVGGVGVERTLEHVTYLPAFGWSPSVVSVANPGYRLVDPASVSRVPPGVAVHRAVSLEPATHPEGRAMAERARRSDGGAGDHDDVDRRPPADSGGRPAGTGEQRLGSDDPAALLSR